MRNIKMIVAYDGGRFGGWQKQSNQSNTIQEILEKLLAGITGDDVSLIASGRTDGGVHAMAQVVNFTTTNDKLKLGELFMALRMSLPGDIVIKDIQEAEERFHARYNAVSKKYLYKIYSAPTPDPFSRKFAYYIQEKLDIAQMKKAAEVFIGEYDFKSFTSDKRSKKSMLRTIYSIEIEQDGNNISIMFHANGFLYNMARILTGTLLEVGKGEMQSTDIPDILAARDRSKAGFTAPPNGLYLYEVKY